MHLTNQSRFCQSWSAESNTATKTAITSIFPGYKVYEYRLCLKTYVVQVKVYTYRVGQKWTVLPKFVTPVYVDM